MSNAELCITLPKELASFVSAKVRSREYDDENDVIRDGLELLKSLESYRAYKVQQLRDTIRVGIEQAEKGMTRPWDKRATERIKAKGRRLLAARRNGKN